MTQDDRPRRDKLPWRGSRRGISHLRGLLTLLVLLLTLQLGVDIVPAQAVQEELGFLEFQQLVRAASRLDKLAMLEPVTEVVGMYLVMGDRFGVVHVYHLTGGASDEIWKSKQLNGVVDEVEVADLDGDAYEDAIVARSSSGVIYVWSGEDFNQVYESLTTDFEKITAMTFGNVDDDDAIEIILNADEHIHYLDGLTFNREWTSMQEYEATRMLCGDVDGDNRNEIILNNGQVLDARSGDVEWEDEVFGSRIELLDMDGDGVLEIITESDGMVVKIYDVDHRMEKHLQ
ncbi:MAG: hypothetical protein ABIF77_00805 [bacterium]